MAPVPAPLTLPPRLPPDRDFDSLRAQAIDVVVANSGPTWTDHNFSDPGITLLEVIAWGLADLHYRTASRGFDLTPLEVPLWLDRAERDWSGLPDLGDPRRLIELAELLAAAAGPLADAIAEANSRQAAISALADRKFGGRTEGMAWDEAAAVVALLRAGRVRRAVLDQSSTVAAAWDEARRTMERRAHGGPVDEADVDAEIVRLLEFEPGLAGLWDAELRTLIRRHRHRLLLERVRAIETELVAASAQPTIGTIKTALDLADDGDALAVLALHPCPPAALPETWETKDGTATTWPPHPLQALATEPVTAEDYATRARGAPDVGRAWTVPGALAGIGWDGRERAQSDPGRLGAVTVLVELTTNPQSVADQRAALRKVLAFLIADPGEDVEVQLPYDTLKTADLNGPRRVMCDELGVALVGTCPVTLTGVLHVALGANRNDVLDGAYARCAPGSRRADPNPRSPPRPVGAGPAGIEGPWPQLAQPVGVGVPGEPIRIHELVQVLADDPIVIGGGRCGGRGRRGTLRARASARPKRRSIRTAFPSCRRSSACRSGSSRGGLPCLGRRAPDYLPLVGHLPAIYADDAASVDQLESYLGLLDDLNRDYAERLAELATWLSPEAVMLWPGDRPIDAGGDAVLARYRAVYDELARWFAFTFPPSWGSDPTPSICGAGSWPERHGCGGGAGRRAASSTGRVLVPGRADRPPVPRRALQVWEAHRFGRRAGFRSSSPGDPVRSLDQPFSDFNRRREAIAFADRYAPAHVLLRVCWVRPAGTWIRSRAPAPRLGDRDVPQARERRALFAGELRRPRNGIRIWECIDEGRPVDRLNVGQLPGGG